MLSQIDVLDVCQVILQRCGLSVLQLAEHMGAPIAPPAAAPKAPAAPLSPTQPAGLPPRCAEALTHAGAPGGVTIAELQQLMSISLQTAYCYVSLLARRGEALRVKLPGIRAARYFAMARDAEAWVVRQPARTARPPAARPKTRPADVQTPDPARVALSTKEKMMLRANLAKRAAAHKAQPMRRASANAPAAAGEPSNPNNVPVTVIETPVDTRHTVAAGDALTGGFSRTPPGINPMTGQPWGAAA